MAQSASFRVFLSAVTHELASYRREVARGLRRKGIEVRDQEHFRQDGATLAEQQLLDLLTGFAPEPVPLSLLSPSALSASLQFDKTSFTAQPKAPADLGPSLSCVSAGAFGWAVNDSGLRAEMKLSDTEIQQRIRDVSS